MAKNKPSSDVYEYAKSLIIALVLAFVIKTSIVEAYKIPSASMESTLTEGDFLLANKFVYGAHLPVPFVDWRLPGYSDPEQGDVVIFTYPVDMRTNYIKRCVATAGQVVEVRDTVLYVDGAPFTDPEFVKFTSFVPQARPIRNDPRINFGPYTVPDGTIFVMGDNRNNSSDSRYWGRLHPVKLNLLQGEAFLIHWSWSPDANAPEIDLADLSTIPKAVFYNVLHFFQRVRWSRLGNIIR